VARTIRWSPRAATDFEDICAYIARDSEHYARLFARKIYKLVEEIPKTPKAGRVVPEYGDENIRERIYENYRIVYRLKKDTVEVVAIRHGSRQLKNI
jgi:toxin ParE1/3/4